MQGNARFKVRDLLHHRPEALVLVFSPVLHQAKKSKMSATAAMKGWQAFLMGRGGRCASAATYFGIFQPRAKRGHHGPKLGLEFGLGLARRLVVRALHLVAKLCQALRLFLCAGLRTTRGRKGVKGAEEGGLDSEDPCRTHTRRTLICSHRSRSRAVSCSCSLSWT